MLKSLLAYSPAIAGSGMASIIRCVDVFFFSSRRRHTRLQGDWSSDVCSSDLDPRGLGGGRGVAARFELVLERAELVGGGAVASLERGGAAGIGGGPVFELGGGLGEGRGGERGRVSGGPGYLKKKNDKQRDGRL